MSQQSYEEFTANAMDEGFTEVVIRNATVNQVISDHQHDFDVSALVAQGELWITVAGVEKHLQPGDTFRLARNTVHSERYGPSEVCLWVARHH